MKLQFRAVEESLQFSAAWGCADRAVELLCSTFRNTWAETLKIRNDVQILDPLRDLSLPGSAVCRPQYEAFLLLEIQDLGYANI